ncbi:MAG: DUF692 domain-containing protein [Geminicoccaceae bacterium]
MAAPLTSLPCSVGIGLKHQHIPAFLDARQPVGWLEVHSENYMGTGGPRLRALETIRRDYGLSCHGVGLSLGSADGLDPVHLQALARLFARIEPESVSEHVAWCVSDGVFMNDLLPLPYTDEALDVLVANIQTAQDAFGRQILIENPSSYVSFTDNDMAEWQFMSEAAKRSGCGLLLDVNNIHVSAHNHDFDAYAYLDGVPLDLVGEIHVAGHMMRQYSQRTILIDDHGGPVSEPVWQLLEAALARTGPMPVLVEWDNDVPALEVLLDEASRAQRFLDVATQRAEPGHAA